MNDSSSQLPLTPEREAYLLCGSALSNVAWLMAQYEKSTDHGLALRAFVHLREAEKHLEGALRHHTDAGQLELYKQRFNTLRACVMSAIEAIEKVNAGAKITAARDLDAKVRRATLLNLYMLSQMLGRGINESYRDVAERTQNTRGAVELALRGYAKPYMARGVDLQDGLLCAFYDIDVETPAELKVLAELDTFELMDKIPGLSDRGAAALILHARGQKAKN